MQPECDPSTILELNTIAIMQFRDGMRQEAMNSFQASMAQLLCYLSLHKQDQLLNVNDDINVEPSVRQRAKRCRENEQADSLRPLKRRQRKSCTSSVANTQVTAATSSSDSLRSPPLPPLLTPPKVSHSCQSPPHAIAIPFETPTADTFPEHASTLFNQCLNFPLMSSDPLPRDHCDLFYASLLYNMGLVLHNYGLQYSCGKSLRKALETYEVAHGVILHDLQRSVNVTASCDVHHWLLYALFNNMANIYAFADSPVMTQYCLERLRWVLAHSDSALLKPCDLLFLVVNLDVLGTAGPGVISASAA